MILLLMIVFAAAAGGYDPSVGDALAFERSSTEAGEWWRPLTSQLAHYDAWHLGFNVFAVVVLGSLALRLSRRATSWVLGLSLFAIPLVVVSRHPELEEFRGLSGVASALVAFVMWMRIAKSSGRIRLALLAVVVAFVGKLVFESANGTALFSGEIASLFATTGEAHVVVAAHAVGGLIGCLVAAISCLSPGDLSLPWSSRRFPVNAYDEGDSQ